MSKSYIQASYFRIHDVQLTEVHRTRHGGYTVEHESCFREDDRVQGILSKGETAISFHDSQDAIVDVWTMSEHESDVGLVYREFDRKSTNHEKRVDMLKYLWTRMDPNCKLHAAKAAVATHPKLGRRVIYFYDAHGESLGWRHLHDVDESAIDDRWIHKTFADDEDFVAESVQEVEIRPPALQCVLF